MSQLREVIQQLAREQVDPVRIGADGRVLDRKSGCWLSRRKFTARLLTSRTLDLAESAVDAPRGRDGVIRCAGLEAAVRREIRLAWGDLLSRLDEQQRSQGDS